MAVQQPLSREMPGPGRRWIKGQSGNPAGRPKGGLHIQELARQHCNEAIEILIQIAKEGQTENARISAAIALLDRGFGKPMQTVNSNVTRVDPDKLTDAELADYLTPDSSADAFEAEGDSEVLN